MKKTDIDRLKEICEKEGFKVFESHGSALFQISKKDPWDGKVGFCWDTFKDNKVFIHFHKDTGNPNEIGPPLLFEDNPKKVKEIGDYLAKCLEDKLNEAGN